MCQGNLYFILQTGTLLRMKGTVFKLQLISTFNPGLSWVNQDVWSPKGFTLCVIRVPGWQSSWAGGGCGSVGIVPVGTNSMVSVRTSVLIPAPTEQAQLVATCKDLRGTVTDQRSSNMATVQTITCLACRSCSQAAHRLASWRENGQAVDAREGNVLS